MERISANCIYFHKELRGVRKTPFLFLSFSILEAYKEKNQFLLKKGTVRQYEPKGLKTVSNRVTIMKENFSKCK